jgi:transcriptional regulator with XRE-family HTH domain
MPPAARSLDHLALGRAVRELRAVHAVSQEELGHRCGLHRNYVGAIERGELNPTYGVLLRLGTGLCVRPSQLVELAERRRSALMAGAAPAPAPIRVPGAPTAG